MNIPALSASVKAENGLDIGKITMFAPPVVAIAVSLLISFFVVWPRFSDILVLQKSNKTLASNADSLEKKSSLLASLDKSTLKSQLVIANEIMPSDKDIFGFLSQVEQIRNSSGVSITNLSVGSIGQFSSNKGGSTTPSQSPPPAPAAPQPGGQDSALSGANMVEMKLSLTSDYRSIMQFLNNLYSLPRVVLVKGVSLASGDAGVTSSMTVDALWQPLPTQLASIESPLATLSKNQQDIIARVENIGTSAPSPVVPEVPKGRSDIFTPFGK